jgi:hypothetical protein
MRKRAGNIIMLFKRQNVPMSAFRGVRMQTENEGQKLASCGKKNVQKKTRPSGLTPD